MEAVSFLRELVAYYTLLESSSAVSLAAASEPPKDSYISLLSLDTHNDRASSVTGASGYCIPIDSHSFTNGLGTPCTLYGTMVIASLRCMLCRDLIFSYFGYSGNNISGCFTAFFILKSYSKKWK